MKPKLLTILALLLCFAAKAQVVFKNNGSNKIFVAIGYFRQQGGWTSQGWFPVEPYEEKSVYSYTALNNPNFYYCAKIVDCDKGFYGDSELYVNEADAFTIANADVVKNYANPALKRYRFKKVSLSGQSRYLVTLNTVNMVCHGKPQGKWKVFLDKEGEDVQKAEDAVFYREVTFDGGKPIGWCKDFYMDGKVKAEFKLLSYLPLVYNGKCSWYKQDGSVERETIYQDGNPVTVTTVAANGEKTVRTARYEIVKLPLQSFFVNSISNEDFLGGRSRTVYPVSLPKGTVEWYYEFTTFRDKAKVEESVKRFSLASDLASIVDQTQILSTSIGMFTNPPGGDICNIYLIDQKSYSAFLAGSRFDHYSQGSRLNYKSGIVQVRGLSLERPNIAIQNPSNLFGINVSVQVVAIVSKL